MPRSRHPKKASEEVIETSKKLTRESQTCFLILPSCNTVCMNVFLEELSKQYPEDMILLCCDGAAWHKSKSLQVPENLEKVVDRLCESICRLSSTLIHSITGREWIIDFFN